MVVALSGRRIDSPDASRAAFPIENAEAVRMRIVELFRELRATVLVCSAACGADLLALEAAEAVGARRRIVLPFEPRLFRETSVTDRPGNWGPAFDRCLLAASAANDLVNLDLPAANESYARTNEFILEESRTLARALQDRVTAVLVWDGMSKGQADFTELFGKAALARQFGVVEVSTL